MLKRWSQLAPEECKEHGTGWAVNIIPEIPIFISAHEARLSLAEVTTIEASHRHLLQSAIQTAITDRLGMFHIRGMRSWAEAEVRIENRHSEKVNSPYVLVALLEAYLECI
jgi:hypothetical protein